MTARRTCRSWARRNRVKLGLFVLAVTACYFLAVEVKGVSSMPVTVAYIAVISTISLLLDIFDSGRK